MQKLDLMNKEIESIKRRIEDDKDEFTRRLMFLDGAKREME